jgi:XTP/dITP diphosphohydrolase
VTSASVSPEASRPLAEQSYDRAVEDLANGNYEQAISGFRAALTIDPTFADARHGLIHALKSAGKIDEAVAVTEALLAADPDDTLAHTSLSILYQHQGRIPEAEAAALRAKLSGWKQQLREQPAPEELSQPMRALYIATMNPGKLRDFAAAAETVSLTPLPGLKEISAPPEDEPTFEGNARMKAIYYSRHAPGEIVLADDSGLEVDALQGAPGVRSARYASDEEFIAPGVTAPDALNNLCLLDRMEDIPPGRRQARYCCVLAAARDGECIAVGSGAVEGEILVSPQGEGGFGYDPLFSLPELGKTMAEIDLITKLSISHRGRALRDLLIRLDATTR